MDDGFDSKKSVEVPLILGPAIYGYRHFDRGLLRNWAWKFNKDPGEDYYRTGVLSPIHREFRWEPGVNTANCYRSVMHNSASRRAAEPGCSCGFYSYFKPQYSHYHDHEISGIVQASGQVTDGSKGMRSEKATIVALCIPCKGRVAIKTALTRILLVVMGVALWITISRVHPATPFWAVLRLFLIPMLLVWCSIMTAFAGIAVVGMAESVDKQSFDKEEAEEILAKLAITYPGIKTYIDEGQMLKDFPPKRPKFDKDVFDDHSE